MRWFTSDLHIGHRLVAGIRGFTGADGEPDTSAHNASLADMWDGTVNAQDIVYILGDIALRATEETFNWIDARAGRKILVAGNHDAVAGFHSSASREQRRWLEHFESIHDFLNLKINGRRVALSHYPYAGEGAREGVERYSQWRLKDLGQPLLHGHTHGNEVAHGHQYHVGLDAHGLNFVPESAIALWLNTLEEE